MRWLRRRTKPTHGDGRLGARPALPGDEVPQSRPAAQPPHDILVSAADLDWRDSSTVLASLAAARPAEPHSIAARIAAALEPCTVTISGSCSRIGPACAGQCPFARVGASVANP